MEAMEAMAATPNRRARPGTGTMDNPWEMLILRHMTTPLLSRRRRRLFPSRSMAMPIINALLCLVLAVALGACASANPRPGASRVEEDVANRTGHRVVWNSTDDNASLAAAASTRDVFRAPGSGGMIARQDVPAARHVQEVWEEPLSLERAIAIALTHNQELQARFEDIGVAQGKAAQASLAKAPVFSGERLFLEGASPGWVLSLAVDLASFLVLPLQRDLGEAEVRRVELGVTAAVLDCIREVREGWYGLVAAQQAHALLQDELLAAESAHEMAQRLRQAGNISELDLLTRRARHEEARLRLARSELAMAEAREQMNARLGLWGAAATWKTPALLPPVPQQELALDDIETLAVNASLDLAMARQNVEVAARELGLKEWTTVLPSLEAGLSRELETGDVLWKRGFSWSAPLLFTTPAYGTKAEGRAAIRREWRRYQAMAVVVRAAARASRLRLLAARQTLEYMEQVVAPLQHNITVQTQLQYNAMQLGVFDLLEAKRQELDRMRELVQARLDYWLARGRAEHLLAGRMIDEPSPLAFSRHKFEPLRLMDSPSGGS